MSRVGWRRLAQISGAIILILWGIRIAEAQSRMQPDRSQPIQIVSDRLEAYDDKKMVVFSGHAVATQSDKTIKADSIALYYKRQQTVKKTPTTSDATEASDLEKIVAKGNVTVTQGAKVVMGEEAVYTQDDQKIIMTGNATLRDGANVIRGERILVYLNENRGVVEGGESKRVTAVIYPEEKKDKKKK